jgi:hypothetical protein
MSALVILLFHLFHEHLIELALCPLVLTGLSIPSPAMYQDRRFKLLEILVFRIKEVIRHLDVLGLGFVGDAVALVVHRAGHEVISGDSFFQELLEIVERCRLSNLSWIRVKKGFEFGRIDNVFFNTLFLYFFITFFFSG